MIDNTVKKTPTKRPVGDSLLLFVISRFIRIAGAVLLILGGIIDLLVGIVIFGFYSSNFVVQYDKIIEPLITKFSTPILLAGVILLGVNFVVGTYFLLQKPWAFRTGLVLSVFHITVYYFIFSVNNTLELVDPYPTSSAPKFYQNIIIGWFITTLIFLVVILLRRFGLGEFHPSRNNKWKKTNWPEEFPGSISVCDTEGKILVMNKRISDYFADSGGKALIGSSIFDCHNPISAQMIRDQINSQKTTVYTHVENGVQEIVLHVPWYQFGKFAGLVEISLPHDGEIEHR